MSFFTRFFAKKTSEQEQASSEELDRYIDWAVENLTASGYEADYSLASMGELDRFIDKESQPEGYLTGPDQRVILFALGAYLGQAAINSYGGKWQSLHTFSEPTTDLTAVLSDGRSIRPVQACIKRLKHGVTASLYSYFLDLAPDPNQTPDLEADNLSQEEIVPGFEELVAQQDLDLDSSLETEFLTDKEADNKESDLLEPVALFSEETNQELARLRQEELDAEKELARLEQIEREAQEELERLKQEELEAQKELERLKQEELQAQKELERLKQEELEAQKEMERLKQEELQAQKEMELLEQEQLERLEREKLDALEELEELADSQPDLLANQGQLLQFPHEKIVNTDDTSLSLAKKVDAHPQEETTLVNENTDFNTEAVTDESDLEQESNLKQEEDELLDWDELEQELKSVGIHPNP